MDHWFIEDFALRWGPAVFAFLAALFWFLSARVKFPENLEASWDAIKGAEELSAALKAQTRYSAWAAVSAGSAAVLQGLKVINDLSLL